MSGRRRPCAIIRSSPRKRGPRPNRTGFPLARELSGKTSMPRPNKKPGIAAGLSYPLIAGPSGRLFLGRLVVGGAFLGGLGTAARALGEGGLDLLDRLGLGDLLHRRD